MKLIAQYRLRNDPAQLRKVEQWVNAFAETAHLSPTARNAFDLSLVEWITNVIDYGYEDSEVHWITVRFSAEGHEARAEVEDDGRAFDPVHQRPVDVTQPLEQRAPGGLGIHLIRKLMDRVEHRRAGQWNILTLTRRRA